MPAMEAMIISKPDSMQLQRLCNGELKPTFVLAEMTMPPEMISKVPRVNIAMSAILLVDSIRRFQGAITGSNKMHRSTIR